MHSYIEKHLLPYLFSRKMNNLLQFVIISFNEKYNYIIRVGKATKINKMLGKLEVEK